MASHERLREDLALWATNDLSQERAREVEEHIESCGECAAELAEIRELLGAMRQVADASTPQPSLDHFYAERVAPALARPVRPAFGPWLKVAALVLAFVAGGITHRWLSELATDPSIPQLTREAGGELRLAAYEAANRGDSGLAAGLLGLSRVVRTERD